MKRFKVFIGGRWVETGETMDVINPYNGDVAGSVYVGGDSEFEEALAGASKAFDNTRRLSSFDRAEALAGIINGLKERRDELARTITLESGKPIKDSQVEVSRAINTFTIAMEEAKRIGGEVVPLDLAGGSHGRFAITRRFPIGVVLGITPFNFPLNLVAHKVAPALACGNTVIIKPSPRTPITALLLAEIIDKVGLPEGSFSVLPCRIETLDRFLNDDRIKMISFTGSAEVGWAVKARAPKKKTLLEMGGNAAVIIDVNADIDFAAGRCVAGAFAYSGQVCISVQRVYVHKEIFETFAERLVQKTEELKAGDPFDQKTVIAPMIDEKAIERIEAWINEAVKGGAKVLAGGKRRERFFMPTVITGTTPDMKVNCKEVFAPLVVLEPYSDFNSAVQEINNSVYGLQAGVFTNDIRKMLYAYENIDVGGVIINDIPTYRADHMPYGGIKDSGFGREGVRYAIEEMTELKLLTIGA